VQDLNDMLFFAEVVERGGFAAASRALGIPKSRLSRRVADLEARLGVRLLQRTTRRLSLTDVGAQYLPHCRAVREQAEAASDLVAQVRTEPHGTLRVSCPVTLAQTSVGELVPRFLAECPGLRLEMLVTNRVVNLVEEGIDVALRVRPSLEDSGSLIVKPLGASPALLVASPALLARQGRPARPQDLAALDTVAMSATEGRMTWRLHGPDGSSHDWVHTPRFVADDLPTLHWAVRGGTGVGALPASLCQADLDAGRLEVVLPGWSPPPGLVHAVYVSRRGLAPAVRRFLDALGAHLNSGAPDAAG
jgi:DNA-binding transcriptional LysR family regulator